MSEPENPTRVGRGRLESISDGIMAVAITLLALGINPPRPEPGESLLDAFDAQTLGGIALFLLSFFVIGRFWLLHHRLFTGLPMTLPLNVVILNFMFLASLCLIPFATATFADHPSDMTALALYTLVIAIGSSLLSIMFRISGPRSLLRSVMPPVVILLAIPAGLVVGPEFAPLIWCVLAVFGGDRIDDLISRRRR